MLGSADLKTLDGLEGHTWFSSEIVGTERTILVSSISDFYFNMYTTAVQNLSFIVQQLKGYVNVYVI